MDNPIQIGLCGWGDHTFYAEGTPAKEKLVAYASYFPVVEVDSTYYAVPQPERMKQWAEKTPPAFRFIVKAYRELTGHGRGKGAPTKSVTEWFAVFKEALLPLRTAGKLQAVLFQFPPWFDCKKENVQYLRRCREELADFPLAIEFRNRTWFEEVYRERTLAFLKKEQLIHVICDEPQAGIGTIPIVPAVTHPNFGIVRFHGRNVEGWNQGGRSNEEWRQVRYAYRYSQAELVEWVQRVQKLQQETRQITLLFNNNSRGDAAPNAQQLGELLQWKPQGLAPRQLDIL